MSILVKARAAKGEYKLDVITWTGSVDFGGHVIAMEDFLAAVRHVLINTDLEPDDPRLKFVESVQSIVQVDGFNPGKERLALPVFMSPVCL